MGAYYQYAEYDEKKRKWFRYNVEGSFWKFLEHAYYHSPVVWHAISRLWKTPKNAVWLCDYHEGEIRWENTKMKKVKSFKIITKVFSYYSSGTVLWFCSEDEGKAINLNYAFNLQNEVMSIIGIREDPIHPIPLLLASDKDYMGGGDIWHPHKGDWAWQRVYVTDKNPGLADVTIEMINPIFIEKPIDYNRISKSSNSYFTPVLKEVDKGLILGILRYRDEEWALIENKTLYSGYYIEISKVK